MAIQRAKSNTGLVAGSDIAIVAHLPCYITFWDDNRLARGSRKSSCARVRITLQESRSWRRRVIMTMFPLSQTERSLGPEKRRVLAKYLSGKKVGKKY